MRLNYLNLLRTIVYKATILVTIFKLNYACFYYFYLTMLALINLLIIATVKKT